MRGSPGWWACAEPPSLPVTPPLHSWVHALIWLRKKPADKSSCVRFLCSRSFLMSMEQHSKVCIIWHLSIFPCTFSAGFLLYCSKSCFIQTSDQPVELFSAAQRSMYILASGHSPFHAKLLDKSPTRRIRTCSEWVCGMATIFFCTIVWGQTYSSLDSSHSSVVGNTHTSMIMS